MYLALFLAHIEYLIKRKKRRKEGQKKEGRKGERERGREEIVCKIALKTINAMHI